MRYSSLFTVVSFLAAHGTGFATAAPVDTSAISSSTNVGEPAELFERNYQPGTGSPTGRSIIHPLASGLSFWLEGSEEQEILILQTPQPNTSNVKGR